MDSYETSHKETSGHLLGHVCLGFFDFVVFVSQKRRQTYHPPDFSVLFGLDCSNAAPPNDPILASYLQRNKTCLVSMGQMRISYSFVGGFV
jgi:hypothetical protein